MENQLTVEEHSSLSSKPRLEIIRLPVLADNYIFLLHDTELHTAAVVDPAQAKPVLDCLDKIGAQLVAIFNTHHHADHIGGNLKLKRHFPQLCVYGGAEDRGRIPAQEVFLQDGDCVTFANRVAQVFFLPGHTSAHITYYFPPETDFDMGDLFCGDTLFAGGCGRLLGGTPAQMVNSLSRIKALPDKTRIWCAHEYTLKNLRFALSVDGENQDLQTRYQDVQKARRLRQATVPSVLKIEKLTNPFLRWEQPALRSAVQSKDPVQTFARLRGLKDRF